MPRPNRSGMVEIGSKAWDTQLPNIPRGARRLRDWNCCQPYDRGRLVELVDSLKGGDVSVGVFDRLVDWPQDGGKLGERLKAFLMKHPVGREILVDARFDEEDVHWRKNLAYYSTTFAGDGFVLVGDAAAFMDPFYSPGMDWISFTTSRAAALIGAQRRGEAMSALVERHNRDLVKSHRCWFGVTRIGMRIHGRI